jgi:hypothetical protein
MQIHDSPEDNERLNGVFKKIAMVVSPIIWWVFWVLMGDANGDKVTYGLQFFGLMVLGILTSIFIIPLAWKIGDFFRRWTKPDMFVAYSAREGFEKKLFWLLGPQTSVALLASSIAFLASLALTAPLATRQPDQRNAVENREKMPQHSGVNRITGSELGTSEMARKNRITGSEGESANSIQGEKTPPAQKDSI